MMMGMGMVTMCLLLSGVYQVMGQCSKTGPCSCEGPDGKIDLSPLANKDNTPRYEDESDPDGSWLYSYNPCQPFDEGDCSSVASCQISSDQSTYYAIGTQDSADFKQDDNGNVMIEYSSTDSGGTTRTTKVTLVCDSSGGTDVLVVDGETSDAVYGMTLTSSACCPSSGPGPGPGPSGNGGDSSLSIGTILCIVLISFIVVYIAAGIAIQKGVRKAQGKEVFPNVGFWSSLPGLIKDGAKFTISRGKKGGYDAI